VIGRLQLVLGLLLLWAAPTVAHESRPGYLELRELTAGRYEVLWKRPARGDLVLGLSVRWPLSCEASAPGAAHAVPGALIERGLLDCGERGLEGQRVFIDGLESTLTDVLVRITFQDGTVQTNLTKPADPWIDIVGPRPTLDVAIDFFGLGVEHILLGIDHLLFVLCLTLIVHGWVLLVKTITAFTVAHSITLAAATFGWVNAPQAPVEAVIALSILFLASELTRQSRGNRGMTSRAPWVVAFAFGLLHGFGFAGALSEIGLPSSDIPMALLAFNLGVEAGQLLFVAQVLVLTWLARTVILAPPRWLREMPAYAVGSLAAFWLLERVASFA
jgi:hydrogenase/urease accessory protein HupE